MAFADKFANGLSEGIRNMYKQRALDELNQPKIDMINSQIEGQNIENSLSQHVLNLITDPNQVAQAAGYAANVPTQKVKAYQFNRDQGFPQVDMTRYGGGVGDAGEMAGISPQATDLINQFMVNQYGSVTNEKGANDFSKGLDTQMQSGIARQASEAATNPNAKVVLSTGKAYEPFKVQDNTVIDTGTGQLGATTGIGQAAIALSNMKEKTESSKQGTESSKQKTESSEQSENYSQGKMYDSKHGFAPSSGGRGTGSNETSKITMRDMAQIRDDIRAEFDVTYPKGATGKRANPKPFREFEKDWLAKFNVPESDYYRQNGTTKPETKKSNPAYDEYKKAYESEKDPSRRKRMTDFARSKGIVK